MLVDGRTALWRAVYEGKPDVAQALIARGADPARPMMSGWSPARLSLLTAHALPTDEVLTPDEQLAVLEAGRLTLALSNLPEWFDGFSLACVAGVDAATAIERLSAEKIELEADTVEEYWDASLDDEEVQRTVGVTDVPGGCVVAQPWYFTASTPVVLNLLSAGTVAYGMYANPKSGSQGSFHRDGRTLQWDQHPGGHPAEQDSARDVLLSLLYHYRPVPYCFAYVGLRPKNNKSLIEPAQWLRLPERDYWHA